MRRFSSLPIFFLALSLLIAGCASSGMSTERQSEIPDGANAVVLESEKPPDQLYRAAYRHLRQSGFSMDESNEEMRSLTTAQNNAGESKLPITIDLFVEEKGSGSELTARADVLISSSLGWADARMAASNAKVTVAYEELVLLMEEIPHQTLQYVEE